jgi:thiosulfate reductase cytochrome b subunit
MESNKMYLYPTWLRIWHGINAICIVMLILTGVSIQYSDLQYHFISFNTAITLHNIFGSIAVISYVCFIVGNLISKNGLQYRMKMKGLMKRLMEQTMYYMFGYFKDAPKPYPISEENKFNPLQRLSYSTAMYFLVPISILTGLALLYPEIIVDDLFDVNGIQITAVIHATVGFFLSLFLIIHLYVASVGKHPLKNFKSIVTGYHERS